MARTAACLSPWLGCMHPRRATSSFVVNMPPMVGGDDHLWLRHPMFVNYVEKQNCTPCSMIACLAPFFCSIFVNFRFNVVQQRPSQHAPKGATMGKSVLFHGMVTRSDGRVALINNQIPLTRTPLKKPAGLHQGDVAFVFPHSSAAVCQKFHQVQ